MRRRDRRSRTGLTVLALVAQAASSPAACDVSAWGDGTWGTGMWQWDPSTYSETLSKSPVNGTVTRIWDVIKTSTKVNCTKSASPWSESYTETLQETIQHAVTGELKVEVGLPVGATDAVALDLTSATISSNGWQVIANLSNSTPRTVSGTLGPCSALQFTVKGKYLKGQHDGSGSLLFSVSVRTWTSPSWTTERGVCKSTQSSADGQKKYVTYAWRTDARKPNCSESSECKKCTTDPPTPGSTP